VSGIPGIKTVEEAAAILGLEPPEVDRLVGIGELRGLRLTGGGWLISQQALVAVLRRRAGWLPPRRRGRRRAASFGRDSHIAVVPTSSALPSPSVTAAVAKALPAEAVPERRSVPVDLRPDVEHNIRLDLAGAAAHLGVDVASVLGAVQQGRLRATRLGRAWITTSRDLRDYAQSRQRLER